MLTEVKHMIIKALQNNPMGAQRVLNEMEAERKIPAIKELRELTTPRLGLREAKDFIEMYMVCEDSDSWNYTYKTNSAKFARDVSKGKRLKFDEMSEFDNIDIKQVSTKALMAFRKKLNKELKSRGKKL